MSISCVMGLIETNKDTALGGRDRAKAEDSKSKRFFALALELVSKKVLRSGNAGPVIGRLIRVAAGADI
jgi:hypothetical protein